MESSVVPNGLINQPEQIPARLEPEMLLTVCATILAISQPDNDNQVIY